MTFNKSTKNQEHVGEKTVQETVLGKLDIHK
jgi:hypothetical protein